MGESNEIGLHGKNFGMSIFTFLKNLHGFLHMVNGRAFEIKRFGFIATRIGFQETCLLHSGPGWHSNSTMGGACCLCKGGRVKVRPLVMVLSPGILTAYWKDHTRSKGWESTKWAVHVDRL